MSWHDLRFKEFVVLQRGFDLPKSQMKEGDVPVLGSNCIIGFHNEAKVEPPGVVTGRSGTIGLVQYTEQPFWPHNTALWVRDFKGNNPRFVCYKLQTLHLEKFNGGVSVPTLNRNVLDTLPVRVPDPSTQEHIASILSAYDDLIENNRRRIQLLEQAARLLYKEWFVLLRFPGHEHVEIKDGVPEGWEKVTVPEIIRINPKEEVIKGSDIHYVPMYSLSESDMTINTSDTEIRQKATSVKFRNGDILLARITPCLENGKTGYVNFLDEDDVACGSTEFIVLRGQSVSPYFTYCLARTYDFRENAIKSMIGSSGRQRVQVSCFDEYSLALPPKILLQQFDEFASRCFEQIWCLMQQNRNLEKARDLLLPRLMNGEIAV